MRVVGGDGAPERVGGVDRIRETRTAPGMERGRVAGEHRSADVAELELHFSFFHREQAAAPLIDGEGIDASKVHRERTRRLDEEESRRRVDRRVHRSTLECEPVLRDAVVEQPQTRARAQLGASDASNRQHCSRPRIGFQDVAPRKRTVLRTVSGQSCGAEDDGDAFARFHHPRRRRGAAHRVQCTRREHDSRGKHHPRPGASESESLCDDRALAQWRRPVRDRTQKRFESHDLQIGVSARIPEIVVRHVALPVAPAGASFHGAGTRGPSRA